jgi:hypothetical protein
VAVRRAHAVLLAAFALGLALVLAGAGVADAPGALSDWQALALGVMQGAIEPGSSSTG